MRNKKIGYSILLAGLLAGTAGCTSTGDFTTDLSEMDVGNTVGFAIGAAITAYAIDSAMDGGGGSYCPYEESKLDYLPGSDQWRCRSVSTGEFTDNCNCAGQAYIDNWP